MRTRRRDWDKIRSTHASVLETLEQVIGRHPANAVPAPPGPRDEIEVGVQAAGDAETGEAVVLQFRPRLTLISGGDTPGAA